MANPYTASKCHDLEGRQYFSTRLHCFVKETTTVKAVQVVGEGTYGAFELVFHAVNDSPASRR